MHLTLGTLFDDRFELVATVGAGGMGVVYHARQPALERDVALKILRTEMCTDEQDLKRFEREAQILCKLDHPNIVSLYTVGSVDGVWYMAMQYVPAPSLQSLTRKGPLTVAQAIDIFLQICSAIACAHAQGVVHRDLKPSNILVADPVKVIDFGLSKFLPREEQQQRLTRTGTALGTAMYMSPEQCMGHEVDERSDIYALGILLYEMLAGEQPFEGDNALAYMHQHVNNVVPPLPTNDPDTWKFSNVIGKATQKKPQSRYQSVEDLTAAVKEAQQSAPPALPPILQQATRAERNSNRGAFIGLLVAGLIAVGAVFALAYNFHLQDAVHNERDMPFVYWRDLCEQEIAEGHWNDAYVAAAQAAAKTTPDDLGTLQTAGLCALNAGHYAEALRFYEKVLSVEPDNRACRIGQLNAYRVLHNNEAVLFASKVYFGLPKDLEHYEWQSAAEARLLVLTKLNRLKEAAQFADFIERNYPAGDPNVEAQLALLQLKLGNRDKAVVLARHHWRVTPLAAAIHAAASYQNNNRDEYERRRPKAEAVIEGHQHFQGGENQFIKDLEESKARHARSVLYRLTHSSKDATGLSDIQ